MMCPPWLLGLRVGSARGRWPRLWLPLFVLWPFAACLALPLCAAVLLGFALLDPKGIAGGAALLCVLYASVCSLRGTRVEVRGPDAEIFVSVL